MPLSGHTIKSMGVREVARVSMWQLTISGIVTSLNYVSDDCADFQKCILEAK